MYIYIYSIYIYISELWTGHGFDYIHLSSSTIIYIYNVSSYNDPNMELLNSWPNGGFYRATLIKLRWFGGYPQIITNHSPTLTKQPSNFSGAKPSNGLWEPVFCQGRRCEGESVCLHLPRLQRECGQWREDRANRPSNGLWEAVFCQGRRCERERW